jgi:hypothetical protein
VRRVIEAVLVFALAMITSALPPPRPAAAQEARDLAGEWALVGDGLQVRVVLRADGRFTRTVKGAEGVDSESGTWSLVEGDLAIRTEGGGEVLRIPFRLVDPDTLELSGEDGTRLRLTRQSPRPIPVPTGPGADVTRLAPCPTGHILYSRAERAMVRDGAGRTTPIPTHQIWVMTGDGRDAAPFVAPPGFEEARDGKWARDGRSVAFASSWRNSASCNYMDAFVVDLAGGALNRVTGCWRSAGPVKGYGTLRINVIAGGIRQERPGTPATATDDETGVMAGRTAISWLGGDGQIRILSQIGRHTLVQNRLGQQVDVGLWQAVIPDVPAGRIWVKGVASSTVGDVAFADVPPGGVGEATLTLCTGNVLVNRPGLTPDGRHVVAEVCWNSVTRRSDESTTGIEFEHREIQSYSAVKVFDAASGQFVGGWDPSVMPLGSSRNPDVSPDGRLVAFNAGPAFLESIVLCSLESLCRSRPEPSVIAKGVTRPDLDLGVAYRYGFISPAWSPDGRRIAFVQTVADTSANLAGNVFVVSADGSGVRQVTRFPAHMLPNRPCWSPDGRRLAFDVSTSRDGKPLNPAKGPNADLEIYTTDIYSIADDGTDLRRLTTDGISGGPSWGR